MEGQLSLEFLIGLVIVTLYIAAVFGFFGSMAEALDRGVQKMQVEAIAKEIDFWAEVHGGDGASKNLQLDLFPSTRLALFAENGIIFVKSCSVATAATYEKRIENAAVVSPALGGVDCRGWPLAGNATITLERAGGVLKIK